MSVFKYHAFIYFMRPPQWYGTGLPFAHPSASNTTKYKTYRNIFNTLRCKSRQLYYTSSLYASEKNPKRTWELLKEVTTGKNERSPISEINSEAGKLLDPPWLLTGLTNSFPPLDPK